MAIRKSTEETIVVSGNRESWLQICQDSLNRAGFDKISVNPTIFQISGNYKKITIWGQILITLIPDGDYTKITAKSTANIDNIYALFRSPTQTIINKFKEHLS